MTFTLKLLLLPALVPLALWTTLQSGLADVSYSLTGMGGQSLQAHALQWWQEADLAATNGQPAYLLTARDVTIAQPVFVECVAGAQLTIRGTRATASSLSLVVKRLDAGDVRLTGFMTGWPADSGAGPTVGTSATEAAFDGPFALASVSAALGGLKIDNPQVSAGSC